MNDSPDLTRKDRRQESKEKFKGVSLRQALYDKYTICRENGKKSFPVSIFDYSKADIYMLKRPLALIILFSVVMQANAQLGVMKLVGKNSSKYDLGFGAFVKSGIPVSDGSDVTLEIGADIFFLNDGYGTADGTIMCPLKAGYRYTLNGTGEGFYVEPQVGFNLVGVTSLHDANGNQINLNYHGVVFAAGAGYLFNIWRAPFDLNLRYETVIDHGGSNNFISLGISRYITFGKRNTQDY